MPDGDNLKTIAFDPVVHPVPDAIDVESPYIGRTGLRNRRADAWLHQQKTKCGFEILSHCSGCGWPVDGPPFNDTFNFASGSTRNVQLKRHDYP